MVTRKARLRDRAQRPHREADAEGQKREDELRRGRCAGEEVLAHDRREQAEDEEIVPLEDGPGRRGRHHRAQLVRRDLLHRLPRLRARRISHAPPPHAPARRREKPAPFGAPRQAARAPCAPCLAFAPPDP
jgi:hypothetical protein